MTFEDLFIKARESNLNLSIGIILEEGKKDFEIRYMVEGFKGTSATGNIRIEEVDAGDEKALFVGIPQSIWARIDQEFNLETAKALIP